MTSEPNAELRQHFRGNIEDLAWPAVAGQAQRDDLNLVDMAKWGLNYLRGNPDPVRQHECKFAIGPLGIPSHVPISPPNQYGFDVVSLGDTDARMDGQYLHMRRMIGEDRPCAVEQGVRRRVMSYLGDDGLAWVNPGAAIGETIEGEWALTWTTAKALLNISETFEQTQDAALRAQARKIFEALRSLAQWDGPRAYYFGIAPYKDGQWLTLGWCATHSRNYPFIVEPLVRYYECTGDTEALDLARAFTEGFLAGSQPDQGELRIDPVTGAFQNHVHLHTHAIYGVAHLGAVLNEPRYLDYAQRAYLFVLSQGTDFGWYPEFIPQPEYRTEICVVGDMLAIAFWLARSGRSQYWDHVERIVRNQLRRSQFRLTPAFIELFTRLHKHEPAAAVEAALAELCKLEGGFVAQSTFDDLVGYPEKLGLAGLYANGIQMMGCCPPEGMRGLWDAYCGAIEDSDGAVRVNMAMHRDHPAAKVTAYRPEFGRLEVQARKGGLYLIRPPHWAPKGQVRLIRNGKDTTPSWGGHDGAYVACEGLEPDETITLTWPVPHFQQTFSPQSIPGRTAELQVNWVGNEVRQVRPPAQHLTMYGC